MLLHKRIGKAGYRLGEPEEPGLRLKEGNLMEFSRQSAHRALHRALRIGWPVAALAVAAVALPHMVAHARASESLEETGQSRLVAKTSAATRAVVPIAAMMAAKRYETGKPAIQVDAAGFFHIDDK